MSWAVTSAHDRSRHRAPADGAGRAGQGARDNDREAQPAYPEIPTAAESGLPGLEFSSWYGLWGPKNMPAETVAWLNTAMADATRELAAAGRLASLGIEPVYESPEEFGTFIKREVSREMPNC